MRVMLATGVIAGFAAAPAIPVSPSREMKARTTNIEMRDTRVFIIELPLNLGAANAEIGAPGKA
jgi:hypothetical protein